MGPVGFITGDATQEMRADASEIPVSFFLARPFTPDQFKATFDAIFDKKTGSK